MQLSKILTPTARLLRYPNQLRSRSVNEKSLIRVLSTTPTDNANARNERGSSGKGRYGIIIGVAATAGLLFAYYEKDLFSDNKASDALQEAETLHRTVRTDLPTIKKEEIQKHDSLEKGVWVSYGIGVYDITKFIPKHPGSEKIMMGAGAAIDPFWNVYQQHKTVQILKLLEEYRIGNLPPEDESGVEDMGSPWTKEPKRHILLKPTSKRPFNAETPLGLLVEKYYTPQDVFYVRNHLPVPNINEKTYELEIEVESSKKTKIFKLADIKKLPKYTVTAAIMCGGNRRSEMNEIKEVKGLSWGPAAVGNAKWSGPKLRDVLLELGVKSNETDHVIFEGLDFDPASNPYAASIPLYKAMDERGDVILAYEMNGEPLNRDHGYPLRVIVPGVVGARNVKWVGRIIVSNKESESHWQQNDYKGFNPSVDWDTVDFSKSPAIQNMPVTSAICVPSAGDSVKVEDGHIIVKGYAWSGGGNRVVRVDLTIDGGNKWHVAEILEQDSTSPGRHYGWTLWESKIPIEKKTKEIEIWAKAVDSNYNVQPETFKNTWNLRGVLSNAYHRVKVILT